MSSAPADQKPPRTHAPFEPWRKVMLLGAFILLGHALFVALVDTAVPEWVSMFFNFMGYGFLVAGFGMKMRQRKDAEEREAEGATGAEKP